MNPDVLSLWANALLIKSVWIIVAVFFDLALGTAIAVNDGEFKWEELPRFLKGFVLFYLAFLAAQVFEFLPELLTDSPPGYTELVANFTGPVIYGLVLAKYLASIGGHIARVFGGDIAAIASKFGFPPTGTA